MTGVGPDAVGENLCQKSYRLEWDRPGEDYGKPVSQQQPLRAIVKDLVLDDISWTQRLVNKI